MEFILSPIALYAALGISVIFFFVLFLITGASARRRERESAEALDQMRLEIAQLREQVQEQVQQARVAAAKVVEPVEEVVPEPVLAASVSVTGPAMNLTKRAQALRLHRMGTDSAEIARRLGIAQGEVRLAVKMHKILVEQNAGT